MTTHGFLFRKSKIAEQTFGVYVPVETWDDDAQDVVGQEVKLGTVSKSFQPGPERWAAVRWDGVAITSAVDSQEAAALVLLEAAKKGGVV